MTVMLAVILGQAPWIYMLHEPGPTRINDHAHDVIADSGRDDPTTESGASDCDEPDPHTHTRGPAGRARTP